jgi:oligopeptidase B
MRRMTRAQLRALLLPNLLLLAPFAIACATAPGGAPTHAPSASSPPAASAAASASTPLVSPPIARREAHVEQLHGLSRTDDYFWLRHKDAADVVAYLKAENAYTDAIMKPTERLQTALYDEMLGRIQETDISVPYRDHGWFYYSRTEKGRQYPIYCRKSARGAAADDRTGATATAPEEVLLDLNEIAKEHQFVGLGPKAVSDDGNIFAYTLDTTGFRQYTLRFKDLRTGKLFPDAIPRVDAVAWAADGRTVFYVVEHEQTKRPFRLYRHVLGSDPANDPLLYEEKDEMFMLLMSRTRSRAFLMTHSFSKTTSEVRYLRADRPNDAWKVVEPRQHDVKYSVDHRGDRFYILTDAPATAGGPKALNFRLVSAPVAQPGRAHWKDLVPHRDDVMLEDVDVFANYAVLYERADALPRVRILPLAKAGAPAEEIKMPEALYDVSAAENAEFDAAVLRLDYQSPVTPQSIYDVDTRTHAMKLLKRQEVLGGYDSSRYVTARTHAIAADGARIPVSLVYRKDLQPSTPHPALLYGYGSYGVPMWMGFRSNAVSLLDRGVVLATAHIRGGGDLGKRWHEQGRMASKMNTFTDFIACAEELVKSRWTAPDRLVIQGGSAGGLLMGAVTNLRPDLWKAVVAQVPFVDVINTMLDESIPLTVGEFEEWGNPKKKDEYDVMIRYSPYDNLAKKAYPAMLVMTSYNDSQVMYWEPAKYVARLRALKTDHNPLVFRTNMDPAGHGGKSGRYDRLHEQAFVFSFVLTQLGITQ